MKLSKEIKSQQLFEEYEERVGRILLERSVQHAQPTFNNFQLFFQNLPFCYFLCFFNNKLENVFEFNIWVPTFWGESGFGNESFFIIIQNY